MQINKVLVTNEYGYNSFGIKLKSDIPPFNGGYGPTINIFILFNYH